MHEITHLLIKSELIKIQKSMSTQVALEKGTLKYFNGHKVIQDHLKDIKGHLPKLLRII